MVSAVLFDFDGVIVDSYTATISYFQTTLAHFHLPVPAAEQFRPFLGLKTRDLLHRVAPSLSEKQFEEVYDFSRHLSVAAVSQITLIPGAVETLEKLHKKYKLGLITNRGKITVGKLFLRFNLRQYFDVVVDRDTVTFPKPHPEGIIKAMNALNVNAKDVIYVGDMPEDIEAANGANVPCVLLGDSADYDQVVFRLSAIKDLPLLVDTISAKG